MKNNLKKTLPVLLLTLLAVKATYGQSAAPPPLTVNAGLEAGFPVGSERSASNFVLGITPQLEYNSCASFRITFTTGVYNYFSKMETIVVNPPGVYFVQPGTVIVGSYTYKTVNEDIMPLKAGFKYLFSGHFYYNLEAGAAIALNNGGNAFDIASGFGYKQSHWDFSVRAEDFINHGSGVTLFARAAYSFK